MDIQAIKAKAAPGRTEILDLFCHGKTPEEISLITGASERQCRRALQWWRNHLDAHKGPLLALKAGAYGLVKLTLFAALTGAMSLDEPYARRARKTNRFDVEVAA